MNKKTRTILVPIDSNDQTVIALSQSYNLARLTKSKIVLLSVDNGKAPNIESRLKELSKEASSAIGNEVQIIIKKGDIFEEIESVADELRPAFIMVGITKDGDGLLKGKNALEMIRKSKHAIITVGGTNNKEGCQKILMPLDLTVISREKIARTAELAKLFNASIQIVGILNNESKLEENKLHMFVNQSVKYIKEQGVQAGSKYIRSKDEPIKIVLDHAKEIDADLIVVISDGDRSMKEIFIGTPVQRLVNNSDVPILILRPIERRDMTQAIF